MARENENFRPILESILTEYGKHVLTVDECMRFTGKGRDWLKSHLGIAGGGTTAENLAIRLSKL